MRRLILCSLALLMATGCSILPKPKTSNTTLYQLTPPSASTSRANTAASHGTKGICDRVLRVQAVTADPPYASDDLLYSDTPQAISSFAWHRWATAPATMLTGDLIDAVTSGRLFRSVLGPDDPGQADLILAVRIDKGPLQVFTRGQDGNRISTEYLSYTATLTDADSGEVFGTRVFQDSRKAEPGPYGGVQAANAIVSKLDAELLSWLRELSRGKACQ